MQGWQNGQKPPSGERAIGPFPLEAWLKSANSRCQHHGGCPDFSNEFFRVLDRNLNDQLDTIDIASVSLGLDVPLNELQRIQAVSAMRGPKARSVDRSRFADFLREKFKVSSRWVESLGEISRVVAEFKTFFQAVTAGRHAEL